MAHRVPQQDPAPTLQHSEPPADRTARIRREAVVIAKGHADIDAGDGIENDALETWLDELDRDENAPSPISRSPASHR